MKILINKKAPFFIADGIKKNKTIKNFKLKKYIGEKYIILFFFTLIKEFHLLNKLKYEFEIRNVKIIGISYFSYIKKKYKIILINDKEKKISFNYGIISPYKYNKAFFFIDKKGIIRYFSIYNLKIKININEILRIIDSWQYKEKESKNYPII
ncbi:MAG: redoxin domain-containing protein [Candidatus Shikimatogenerans bostrichidophilus]|nr:MAG: redoxin domain-containing protein [Candidatus Shikimatogenerans bostrichidophilus]